MNTINCRIKLNEYSDVGARDVTPAEVLIIRELHSKNAGGDPIRNAVAAGVTERSDGEEYTRLLKKYPGRSPKSERPIVEEILGPRHTTRLPQTFREVALTVESPEESAAAEESAPRKRRGRPTKETEEITEES